MTNHPMVADADLGRLLESFAAFMARAGTPHQPGVCLQAVQHPAPVVRVVATPIGLLRLAAHVLQRLNDSEARDQPEEFERISTSDSSALVIELVDTMPTSPATLGRPRAGLRAAAMTGLWLSSLFLWAIGLYASITWVGARLASW